MIDAAPDTNNTVSYAPTVQVKLMLILGNSTQQQMGNAMSMLPSLFLNLFLSLRINSFTTDSKRYYSLVRLLFLCKG